jgi:biotin carboxyl carrier protein
MHYYVSNAGKQIVADVAALDRQHFAVSLDGQTSEADAVSIGPDAANILINDRSYEVHVADEAGEFLVYSKGRPLRIAVANEQRFRLGNGTAAFAIQGKQVVVAPMPGKIARVLVSLGDEVREGQGVVVVEAMKMENELKSPKSGRVIELHAAEGSAVEKNATLIVVE